MIIKNRMVRLFVGIGVVMIITLVVALNFFRVQQHASDVASGIAALQELEPNVEVGELIDRYSVLVVECGDYSFFSLLDMEIDERREHRECISELSEVEKQIVRLGWCFDVQDQVLGGVGFLPCEHPQEINVKTRPVSEQYPFGIEADSIQAGWLWGLDGLSGDNLQEDGTNSVLGFLCNDRGQTQTRINLDYQGFFPDSSYEVRLHIPELEVSVHTTGRSMVGSFDIFEFDFMKEILRSIYYDYPASILFSANTDHLTYERTINVHIVDTFEVVDISLLRPAIANFIETCELFYRES